MKSGTTGFKGGNVLLVNYSTATIAGIMGQSRFTIAPSKTAQVAPKPNDANKPDGYQATFAFQLESGWVKFCDTFWPLDPDIRTITIIHKDEKSGRIRLRSIDQRVTFPPPPRQAQDGPRSGSPARSVDRKG